MQCEKWRFFGDSKYWLPT